VRLGPWELGVPERAQPTPRTIPSCAVWRASETDEEIATSLHLSQSTVKTHIARTLTKLDARDRIHLAVLAHRHGLA